MTTSSCRSKLGVSEIVAAIALTSIVVAAMTLLLFHSYSYVGSFSSVIQQTVDEKIAREKERFIIEHVYDDHIYVYNVGEIEIKIDKVYVNHVDQTSLVSSPTLPYTLKPGEYVDINLPGVTDDDYIVVVSLRGNKAYWGG